VILFILISNLLSVEVGPHIGLYILSMLLLWPLYQFCLCLLVTVIYFIPCIGTLHYCRHGSTRSISNLSRVSSHRAMLFPSWVQHPPGEYMCFGVIPFISYSQVNYKANFVPPASFGPISLSGEKDSAKRCKFQS
jgi:hypothetical protein